MYKNFQHFLKFLCKKSTFLSFYHQQMLVQRPTSILSSPNNKVINVRVLVQLVYMYIRY